MSLFCNIYNIYNSYCQAFYAKKCAKQPPKRIDLSTLGANFVHFLLQNYVIPFPTAVQSTRSTAGWRSPVSQSTSSVSQSMISSCRVSQAAVSARSSGVGS